MKIVLKNLPQIICIGVKSAVVAFSAWFVLSVSAHAAPSYEARILHEKDWQVVCDNSNRCVAAGYRAANSTSNPVAIIIYRDAGPGRRPIVSIKTQFDTMLDNDVVVRVGDTEIMSLETDNRVLRPSVFFNDMQLSKEQTDALLPWLLKAEQIEVRQNNSKLFISMAGVKEVLLKMDEWQGRLDTPGALAQRGNKPESSVFKPATIPALRPLVVVADTKPVDPALAQTILAQIDRKTLDPECQPQHDKTAKVHRLTYDKLVLSLTCPKRVYGNMTHNWVTQDKPVYQPVAIEAKGTYIVIKGGTFSARGYFRQTTTGRNTDDCYDEESWLFTDKGFELESVWTTGLCRGFAYGATNFFVYKTNVTN